MFNNENTYIAFSITLCDNAIIAVSLNRLVPKHNFFIITYKDVATDEGLLKEVSNP